MPSVVLALVVVAVTLCVILWRWNRRHMEKLAARIPGPPTWPIIGNVLDVGVTTEELYRNSFRLNKEYGSTVRVWLGPALVVAVCKPEDLKIVLSSPKCIEKSWTYKLIRHVFGNGLITAPGEIWKRHRKIITPTFHFKVLEKFMNIMDRQCSILIKALEKEVNGPSFDISLYLSCFSLDMNVGTVMGLHSNTQANNDTTYIDAIKDASDQTTERILRPWLFFDYIFKRTSLGKRSKRTIDVVHESSRNLIQRKQEEIKKHLQDKKATNSEVTELNDKYKPFLDVLVTENLTKQTLTETEIQDEVDTFLAAGYETTSTTLGIMLWLLSTHQDVQERLYEEINGVFSKAYKSFTTEVLNEMKYLDCVVRETLRLYPTIPVVLRNVTEDLALTGNVIVPAPSTISIPISAIHRNAEVYPEPDAFIPERFMSELENTEVYKKYTFIPFSAGPRNCIGKKFAMQSLKTALSRIMFHYKVLPDDEYKPIFKACITLQVSNGVKIKIVSRSA